MPDQNSKEALQNILRQLDGARSGSVEFDEFIDLWSRFLKGGPLENLTDRAEIDQRAMSAVAGMTQGRTHSRVAPEITRMINEMEVAAYLVRSDGAILEGNVAARRIPGAEAANVVSDLPFEPASGNSLLREVERNLTRNSQDPHHLRAVEAETDRTVTLALSPFVRPGDGAPVALLFVIRPEFSVEIVARIGATFGLSAAECEVLNQFVDGSSVTQIAASRGRSEATVRAQFRAIFAKVGVDTQVDLLNTVISLARFNSGLVAMDLRLRHPTRRTLNLLRPDGSGVEVTTFGATSGRTVLLVHDPYRYTFTSAVERAADSAGLRFVVVCRAGYGRTDPPASPDTTRLDATAADFAMTMDHLGLSNAPLVGVGAAAPVTHRLAARLGNRVSALAFVSASPPPGMAQPNGVSAGWIASILKTLTVSRSMARFLTVSGIRAMVSLGARRFICLQMRGTSDLKEAESDPEILTEFDASLRNASLLGLGALTEDMETLFQDWRDDAFAHDLSVHLIHGDADQIHPIAAIEAFASVDPKRIRLTSVSGAGYFLLETRPDDVMVHIAELFFSQKDRPA
ncbi:alpha/beta fold hydrolase [Marivivens marinus]|uniref:alpha/beta fold hydrolase n=1 Tax=Marivivens marinus TaxID=3110173 RepID=UPI003B849237